MARTIKSMIEAALREITALSEAEQATADMIEDPKEIFAELINQWSFEGLMVPYLSRDTLIGDTSKASYSWGPGGDINSVAPVNVAAVSFQLENGQFPLSRMTEQMMMSRPWLGNVSQPEFFYYEKGPQPLLRFDCAPYGGAFLILSEKALDANIELTDDLEFPDQYARMIRTNLAIDLCPAYEKEPSGALMAVAASSKKIVKRYNSSQPPSASTDLPGTRYSNLYLPLKTV